MPQLQYRKVGNAQKKKKEKKMVSLTVHALVSRLPQVTSAVVAHVVLTVDAGGIWSTSLWVAVQGGVVLAVTPCESSGTAALVQTGIRVLAYPSILKQNITMNELYLTSGV
jgi:hypothetical protein